MHATATLGNDATKSRYFRATFSGHVRKAPLTLRALLACCLLYAQGLGHDAQDLPQVLPVGAHQALAAQRASFVARGGAESDVPGASSFWLTVTRPLTEHQSEAQKRDCNVQTVPRRSSAVALVCTRPLSDRDQDMHYAQLSSRPGPPRMLHREAIQAGETGLILLQHEVHDDFVNLLGLTHWALACLVPCPPSN